MEECIIDFQHKKYVLVITCTCEMYNDEESTKATITQLSPIDYMSERNTLIEKIKDMSNTQLPNEESQQITITPRKEKEKKKKGGKDQNTKVYTMFQYIY